MYLLFYFEDVIGDATKNILSKISGISFGGSNANKKEIYEPKVSFIIWFHHSL